VRLPSRRRVALGTRFLFELWLKRLAKPLEVEGEVIGVQTGQKGGFEVTVRYRFGEDRTVLDAALRELYEDHEKDTVRAHPRVPIHVIAKDTRSSTRYVIHNLSKGGAGLTIQGDGEMPKHLEPGVLTLIQVESAEERASFHGAIAWVRTPKLGVRFGKFQKSTAATLDRLLVLYALPLDSLRVTVSFGADAISRMP
jgi:hypothetical protein